MCINLPTRQSTASSLPSRCFRLRAQLTSLLIIPLLAGSIFAQSQKYGPAQRQEAPVDNPAAGPQQAPGYYATPPSSGTYAGPARSVGVEGLALHFPAISLRLPTIELPCLFSTRRQPKVMVDAAQAPYVQHQHPVGVGAPLAVQAIAPVASPEEPLENPPDPYSGQKDSYQKDAYQKDAYQKEARLNGAQQQELDELKAQVAILAESLERMTRIAELSARSQPEVNRMSYNQPIEPETLEPPTRVHRLPPDRRAIRALPPVR